MSFSNHADAFYAGYKRERVTAKPPNANGQSYFQPDNERVSDVVLSGLGDGTDYAGDAAAITSGAATSFANTLNSTINPPPPAPTPAAAPAASSSKLPLFLGLAAVGGFLLLRK